LSAGRDQEGLCDGMTDAIIIRLNQIQELKVTGTNSVMHYKNTDKDIPQIGRELGVENIVDGRLQREKAFEFLKRALEINPNLGDVNFLAGMIYLYHGLYDQGVRYLTKAMELDPYNFWTPYKLAMCYMSSGEFEKAALNFEKYFELAPVEIPLYDKLRGDERFQMLVKREKALYEQDLKKYGAL
jgi:tetratricopeptide (TPR) repeat protein